MARATNLITVQDRQTQTVTPTESEQATSKVVENHGNHQRDKEMATTSQDEVKNTDGNHANKGSYLGFFSKAAAVIGTVAFVGANVVVPGLGFAAGGIVSGSLAASMMSVSAIANGGTIAAGSAVAVLQSIGATGVGLVTCAGVGLAGGAAATAALKAGEVTIGAIRTIASDSTSGTTRSVKTQTE